jgi:pimeloyl-ACP methyl ester carboxylesterase
MTLPKDTRFARPSRVLVGTGIRPLIGVALMLSMTGCVPLQPIDRLAPEIGKGRLVEVDGLRIHVEDRGSGEAIVLVHGFGGSTFSWRLVAPELSRKYRVIAVDLVGFGLSARPDDRRRYSRASQVSILLGIADRLGLESAHWVGHSYGGGLVTTVARRHPRRVRSLTLIASTAPDYAERRRGLAGVRIVAAPFVRLFALRPGFVRRALERSMFDASSVDDTLVSAYLERLRVEGAVDAYVGLTAPQVAPGDGWDVDLSAIEIPTLLLWGEQDVLIPLADARDAAAVMPDATLVSIPECGHLVMEEQPDLVIREIVGFLRGLEDPTAPTRSFSPQPIDDALQNER